MSRPVLYVNEDNLIKLSGLKDVALDTYVNDAAGSFSVLDSDGTVVSGADGIAMSYVSGSNGNYVGYLDKAIANTLTEYGRYQVAVTLASSGRDLYRKVWAIASYHGVY